LSPLFGFAVALDLIEALQGFLPDAPDPRGSSLSQLRVVFSIPCSLDGTQCIPLAIEFAAAYVGTLGLNGLASRFLNS